MIPTLKRLFGAQTFTLESLFCDESEARKKLRDRRTNTILRDDVRRSFTESAGYVLEKFSVPRAVLFRQVATPTHEVIRFLRIAEHLRLEPLILEYYGDKFVSAGNPYKRALGKMPIYQQTGIDGREIVRNRTVVDFNSYTGKTLGEVNCKDGTSLVDFHHRLLRELTGFDTEKNCLDATEWFRSVGGHAHEYYEHFLRLFVRDGILFENFHPTAAERPLVEGTVLPAFAAVRSTFGVEPLISHLVPLHKELRPYWDFYPREIERFLPEA